jgi:hypothetical protein
MAYNQAGRHGTDCKLHQLLYVHLLVQSDILWLIYLPLFYSLFVFLWGIFTFGSHMYIKLKWHDDTPDQETKDSDSEE